MKQFGRAVAVLALVLASLVLAPAASASSGTLVITSNTTLTEDRTGSIIVARNGITLDCAGHTVTGTGPGSATGVELTGRNNVTVEDCHVTNFDRGFLVVETSGSTFLNNVAENNQLSGFDLFDSSGDALIGNRADGNLVHGFSAVGGGNHTAKGNSASGNAHTGFNFISSANNTIKENLSTDNGDNGIDINASSGNEVRGNTATGNGLFGIALSSFAHDNTVKDNVASGNGEFGIVLFDASNNRMTGNTALSNGVFDAAQDGVFPFSGNVWIDNTFGTTFGI